MSTSAETASVLRDGRRATLRPLPYEHPVAQHLFEQVQQEYVARYGGRDAAVVEPAEFLPPRGIFLVAEVDGRVAGRVSVRHALTPWLAEWGGHIGFGVRPEFRRRGVATALLRAGLRVAGGVQVERALVTCDAANVASAATIERCGGMFERLSRPDEHGRCVRRYWIDRAAGEAGAGRPVLRDHAHGAATPARAASRAASRRS